MKKYSLHYHNMHVWVYRHKGSAKECLVNSLHKGRIEWANVSGEYKRDLNDYIPLCKFDHFMFDFKNKSIKELIEIDKLKQGIVKNDFSQQEAMVGEGYPSLKKSLGE